MQSSIAIVYFTFIIGAVITAVFPQTAFSTTGSVSGAPRVLIVGDSLSAAHNISIQQSWPVLFHNRLRQLYPDSEVFNASISGETSQGGLQRLPALLDKYRPAQLILELGGNDGLRGYNFEQTQKNLAGMISLAMTRNIQVLLIGVRMPPNLGPVYNRRFQQIYHALEQKYDVTYLPRFLEGIAASNAEYMQEDGIHPTALAQPLLAERVLQVFRQQLIN